MLVNGSVRASGGVLSDGNDDSDLSRGGVRSGCVAVDRSGRNGVALGRCSDSSIAGECACDGRRGCESCLVAASGDYLTRRARNNGGNDRRGHSRGLMDGGGARGTNNGVSSVPDRVGGNRDTVRGLLGSLGGLRRTASLARCNSQDRRSSVRLGQSLTSADGSFGYRADSSGSVDFLSLCGRSRSRLSGLYTTALAASDNESARGGVCESLALLDSSNGAQRGGGVHGLSACDIGSRLSRGRNPGRRRNAAAFAASNGQDRSQCCCLCVGLATADGSVGCGAHSSGSIGDKGRSSIVLSRGRSNR